MTHQLIAWRKEEEVLGKVERLPEKLFIYISGREMGQQDEARDGRRNGRGDGGDQLLFDGLQQLSTTTTTRKKATKKATRMVSFPPSFVRLDLPKDRGVLDWFLHCN